MISYEGKPRDHAGRQTPPAGATFRDQDGKVLNSGALDLLDGQIQTIRSVQNPDTLRHVGPVVDA
jgi:RNA polymerase sigma-70 factor (ECF subfamily)